jgi:hypothetical protein
VSAPEPRVEDVPGDPWAIHRDAQIDAWLTTTPAQRLAWLEEAIVFAHHAGALPREPDSRSR